MRCLPIIQYTGCAKKSTNRMLLEPRCTISITSSRHPLEMFFARFLLRLSRIKRSQDILMGQFSPTALNFCYYFYLLVLFLGHPVDDIENENYFQSQHLLKYGRGYDGQIVWGLCLTNSQQSHHQSDHFVFQCFFLLTEKPNFARQASDWNLTFLKSYFTFFLSPRPWGLAYDLFRLLPQHTTPHPQLCLTSTRPGEKTIKDLEWAEVNIEKQQKKAKVDWTFFKEPI